MFRKFRVGTTTHGNTTTGFFVTDAHDGELDSRPKAIVFPVSVLYDAAMQEQRADDYCDYLNLLVDASKQAYENNKLVNILKAV